MWALTKEKDMGQIPRHRVFISYCRRDDEHYKDQLLSVQEQDIIRRKYISIFESHQLNDYRIDDALKTDEQVRLEIRDRYMAGAEVLILLCGENTRKIKQIDWEIQAAMSSDSRHAKLGILVINLPSIDSKSMLLACDEEDEEAMGSDMKWKPATRDPEVMRNAYPYLPDRLLENLQRDGVYIAIASWINIGNDPQAIKKLIDNAYKRAQDNNYDASARLKGRDPNRFRFR